MPEQPRSGEESSRRRRSRLATGAAALLLAGHAVLLVSHFQPATASRDAHGYLIQARLLSEHAHTWLEPRSSVEYIPETWIDRGDGRYFCSYPPGLPLLIAPAWRLGGNAASLALLLALAPLTLLGTWVFCRHWLDAEWSLLVVVLLACNVTFNTQALTADSHLAATCVLVWGLAALCRWESTRKPAMALLAGLLFGAVPAIRYLEGVLVLAAVVFAIASGAARAPHRRSLGALVAGSAIPLLMLGVRNHLVYGAPLRTGYGRTGDSGTFGLDNLLDGGVRLLLNIPLHGVGVVFLLAIAGLAVMLWRRNQRARGILLGLLVAPPTLAYCCVSFEQFAVTDYGHITAGQSPLRYVLPTFVGYLVAAAWLLQRLSRRHLPAATGVAIVVAVATAGPGLLHSLDHLGELESQNEEIAAIQRVLADNVPTGQVLIANRGLAAHLASTGRWELVDEALLLFATGCDPGHLEVVIREHPLKPYWERAGDQNFRAYYKADPQIRLRSLRLGISDLAPPGGQVFWAGTPLEIACFDLQLPTAESLFEVARFDGAPPSRAPIGQSSAGMTLARWAVH
jgi:hypothetical protein